MRRVLFAVIAALVGLALTAVPALATESGAGAEGMPGIQTDEDINGVLFALIVGTIAGVFLFLDAYTGQEETDTHGDGDDAH